MRQNVHGWYIGQKILCIDGRFHKGVSEWCSSVPAVGDYYTIRRIQFGRDAYTNDSGLGFLLEEVVNPVNLDGRESGFFSDRFRPLSYAELVLREGTSSTCRDILPRSNQEMQLTPGQACCPVVT